MPANDNSEEALAETKRIAKEFDSTLNGRSFEEMANDPEFTDEDAKRELLEYSKALRQEFEDKQYAEPENVAQHTQDYFKANSPHAIAQIVWLSINAESETVRMNASKYIIDHAIKKEDADKDPVSALLRKLAGNDKNKQPTGGDSPEAAPATPVNAVSNENLADEGTG